MTRGRAIDRAELVAVVARLEDTDAADVQGAVHSSAIADEIGATRDSARRPLRELVADGVLDECFGLGPHGPRRCYRIPDGSDDEDIPEVSVYG